MARLPGDMHGPFYEDLPPPASTAAAREAARFLEAGELPDGPFTVDHYREAALRHKAGRLTDPELVLVALLVRLQHDERLPTCRPLLQRAGAGERYVAPRPLPPALALVADHRLRRIKAGARDALLGWAVGTHPGTLAMGRVTARELLDAQAVGTRHVGVGLPLPPFLEVDEGYPGGFVHHDLCHLAKYRGSVDDDRVLAGQVGFFAGFRDVADAEPALLAPMEAGQAGLDISLVASDTNGDVRLLVTLFLERLLTQRQATFTAPEDARVLAARYLERLGIPANDAKAAAAELRVTRSAALARLAPHFEARGRAILAVRPSPVSVLPCFREPIRPRK